MKPILIYDGKCGFCRIWVDYWREITGGDLEYAASQDVAESYPRIPREEFAKSVQLVLPSGEVMSGARAVFESLAVNPAYRWPLAAYHRIPGLAPLTEASYRLIAANRNLFYWVTVLLFGRKVEPLTYAAVESLFVRLIGVIYFLAFASFGMQAMGLIGSNGILPVSLYLERVSQALGSSSYRLVPTIFWLSASDGMIRAVCLAGAVCALLAIAGVLWRAALAIAFVLYLSLVSASQEFLGYQWDLLLLESGFLAIFLGYSRVVIWLFRWLLFRLMFFSGLVKLLSGDPTWRNLTALTFHYQTQPIPTPLAWYAQQLPVWFQKSSCLWVFIIELGASVLVLGPRRARVFALPWLVGLQVLILLTGNYAFFNLLAISLCVFLLDDRIIGRIVRPRLTPVRRPYVAWALTIIIAVLTVLQADASLFGNLPPGATAVLDATAPFGIANSYGLFANMTTTRPEIVVEGSNDGVDWRPYEFKYKPGPLNRRPPWVAPYQPRLDWQMWFAALGSFRENVWFVNFVARLLQGRPEVLTLLAANPFPGDPPRLVRAMGYEYRFSDPETRRRTGEWWVRTEVAPYLPAVSLSSLSGLRLFEHAPHQQ